MMGGGGGAEKVSPATREKTEGMFPFWLDLGNLSQVTQFS